MAVAGCGLVLGAATTVRAQIPTPAAGTGDGSGRLVGRVVYQGRGVGIPFASVTLTPSGVSRFADSSGAFAFVRVTPGVYHVRARQIGFVPFDTTVQVRPAPAVTSVTLNLHRVIQLSRITTRARGTKECIAPGIPDSLVDPALYLVFSQVKENVARLRILMNSYPFRYRRENEFLLRQGSGPDQMTEMDTVNLESWEEDPYQPGQVVVNGTNQHGQPGQFMHLVQFQDMADPAFIQTHCFHIADRDKNDSSANPLIRIDFRPWIKLEAPDVEGSIYMDPERYIVKRARFHLTRSRETSPPIHDWTYYSSFNEVVPLVPVVSGFQSFVQAGQPGTQIEEGRVLDYTFIQEAPVNPNVRDTLAGSAVTKTIVGQAELPADPEHPCTPPISQTIVESVTGKLLPPQAGADPSWASAARSLLTELQARLSLPTTLGLSTFGYAAPASATDAAGRGALRIAPSIFGRYVLTVDPSGVVDEVRIVSTSLSTDVDSAVSVAARGIKVDGLRGQTVVLSVSTTSDTTGVSFVHMQVPSWLQTRAASPPPGVRAQPVSAGNADTAVVEFIVDHEGRPVLSTIHRIGVPADVLGQPQMDALTLTAADSLSRSVYLPALIGRCPVTQVTTQRLVLRR
jgi:hypothetical protein